MTEQKPLLSDAGARRRERMLGELQSEMIRVHRNRRMRLSGVGLALCALLVATIFVMVSERPSDPVDPRVMVAEQSHSVKITRIVRSSISAEPISPTGIRMVEISTQDVLDSFAKANIAAGVRCESSSNRCEIFFPGRSDTSDLIVQ